MTEGRFDPPSVVVETALAASRSNGGCVVIVEDAGEVEARFANNTPTTNGRRRQRRMTVVSVRSTGAGSAVGVASRSGSVDVVDLVRASEADAAQAPPAEDASPLVEPSGPAAADFSEPAAGNDASVLSRVLEDLGGAFDRARAGNHVLSGFAWHRLETVYVGTTTGLRLRHEQPTGSMELVGRSPDGSRSAWTANGTRWFDDVDLTAMHDRIGRRLEWAQRRLDLPAGRYQAILPPDATADLMVPVSQAMSGRDAEDGRSVFSASEGATKVGASLSATPFDLRSDPAEPGLQCVPFVVASASGSDVSVFDNGMPVGRTHWLEGGQVQHLQYHRAGARRSHTEPSPPVDNLVLEAPGSTLTVDEMVASSERALLLTCLWYIREVDPVTLLLTGITRDGVYLVERGEVVGAVNNFRFNESPVGILSRVAETGRTERAISREWNEWMNRTAMPALRVSDFNMTSVSPAN